MEAAAFLAAGEGHGKLDIEQHIINVPGCLHERSWTFLLPGSWDGGVMGPKKNFVGLRGDWGACRFCSQVRSRRECAVGFASVAFCSVTRGWFINHPMDGESHYEA